MSDRVPPPRLRLERLPPDPEKVTLLDYFAAAVLVAGLGISGADVFDKAAALVAESHKRKGLTP